MKLPITSWKQTLSALGYRARRVWNQNPQEKVPKSAEMELGVETLEPRQMLSVTISNFGLVNDTGSSNTDLITSDPEVTGVSSAGSPLATHSIEFDNYGDGSVDHSMNLSENGQTFTYDPASVDPAIDSHTGPFAIKYRTVETVFGSSTYGSWETFNYEIQPDPAPEIAVADQSLVNVADGGQVHIGDTAVGEPIDYTFTIYNWGNQDLTLDQSSLTVPSGFSIVSNFASTVTPNSNTSFTIRLDATAAGIQSGTLSFTNNDPDEGTFDFLITGDVAVSAPDIEIRTGTGWLLSDGVSSFNFGNKPTSQNKAIEFIIGNTGTDTLNLDLNSLTVPAGFTVTTQPAATVMAGGGTTNMIIEFDATTLGSYSGDVSIGSDDPNESPYTFSISGEVSNEIGVTNFDLLNEIGRGDRSADPIVEGQVTGDFAGGYAQVQFDLTGDQTVDGSVVVQNDGDWFQYDPRSTDPNYGNQLGNHTIHYRHASFDVSGVLQYTGSWQTYNFELVEDTSLGDLTIDHFRLLLDSGTVNDDQVTTSPILGGVVNGTIGAGHVEVQFDHDEDGTVEGVATINESGQVFAYDPRETDSNFGVSTSTINVKYRLAKFDSSGALLTSGAWGTFSLIYEAPPAGDITVDTFELKTDDGDDTTDNISTISTLQGTVSASNGGDDVTVEFDHTGDGNVDGSTRTQLGLTFEYDNHGLGYGQHTVHARATYWDPAYGVERQGSWTSFTFTIEPEAAPAIDATTIGLVNDTGDDAEDQITLDPAIKGMLVEDAEQKQHIKIELSTDGTNPVDEVWTDEDGNFEILPEDLTPGAQSIYLRSAKFDAQLNDYVYGDWEQFDFTLEATTAGTVSELEVASDTGTDPADGITTDRRVRGTVMGIEEGVGTTVEFDYDGDGDAEGYTTTDSYGVFFFDPVGIGTGSKTISARAVSWDSYNQESVYGAWTNLTYTIDTHSLQSPSVTDLQLVYDDDENLTVTNSLITGSLNVNYGELEESGNSAYQLVQFDIDGDQVSDAERQTNAQGQFQFQATGLAFGSNTIGVRGRAWDYDNQQYAWGNWETITFTLEDKTNLAPTIGSIHLLADTGSSSSDDITDTLAIYGTVTDDNRAGGVTIEIDEDGDTSTIEGITFSREDGNFYYTLGPNNYGSVSVIARPAQWDAHTGSYLTGAWTTFAFTYQPQTNAAPEVVEVNSSVDGNEVTISGRISNERQLGGIAVEIDIDNDNSTNFEATTNEFGEFSFSTSDLPTGTHNIQVRAREIDYNAGTLLTGAWFASSVTIEAAAGTFGSVSLLELGEDNGVSSTDGITSDATLTGNIQENGEAVAYARVEFDHDNDDVVDGIAIADAEGNFNYQPYDLDEGSNTIRARVQQVNGDGIVSYSAWSSITFTLEAPTVETMHVDQLSLANDTGTDTANLITDDATLTGTVANATDPEGVRVEIDLDFDGVADATVFTDVNGEFTYAPEDLEDDYHFVRARTVNYDEFGFQQTSHWATLGFVLHNDPDSTEAQDLLDANDQFAADYETSVDNFINELRTVTHNYRSSAQTTQADYNTAISNLLTTYSTDIGTARTTYFDALDTAHDQYSVDVQNALSTYQATSTGEVYHDLYAFYVPTEFATNRVELPDEADRLIAPVDEPIFDGELHDFAKDGLYDVDKTNAENTRGTSYKTADDNFWNAIKLIDDDLKGRLEDADNDYKTELATAWSNYQAAIPSVDITAEVASLKNQILAEYGKRDVKLENIEAWYQEALADLQSQHSNTSTSNHTYTVDASELNRQRLSKIADAKAAANVVIFMLENSIDDLHSQRKVELALGQDDGNGNYDILNGKLGAYLTYLKAKSAALETKESEIADAISDHMVAEANELHTYDVAIANAEHVYAHALATATQNAINRRQAADANSSWWNYQNELAQNAYDYLTDTANGKHSAALTEAGAIQTESIATAGAVKLQLETYALAKQDRTDARSTALYDYQKGTVLETYTRETTGSNIWADLKTDRSDARGVYENALADATHATNILDSVAYTTFWNIVFNDPNVTQQQIDDANEDLAYETAWNDNYHTHETINAKEAYALARTVARKDYHQDYALAEKDFIHATAVLLTTYEHTLSDIDHGTGLGTSNYYAQLRDANALAYNTMIAAAQTRRTAVSNAWTTYQTDESNDFAQWQIDNATEKHLHTYGAGTSYVSSLTTWDTVNDTPWTNFVLTSGQNLEAQLQRLADAELAETTSRYNAQAVNEIAHDAAAGVFVGAVSAARATYDTGSTNADDAAFNRDQSAQLIQEQDFHSKVEDHDKNVADDNETYQNQVAARDKTLQDAIDDAQWIYERALADLLFQLAVDEIDQVQHDSQAAAAEATRKQSVANAEKARAQGLADDYVININSISDEKISLATNLQTVRTTFANGLRDSQDLYADETEGVENTYDADYATASEDLAVDEMEAENTNLVANAVAAATYGRVAARELNTAKSDRDDEWDAYHAAVHAEHLSKLDAANGATPEDWKVAQRADAQADSDAHASAATTRSTYNTAQAAAYETQLTSEFNARVQQANDIEASNNAHNSAIESASATLYTSNRAASTAYGTSVIKADSTQFRDKILAEAQFDVDIVSARAQEEKDNAASWHDYIDTVSNARADWYLDVITQTAFDTIKLTEQTDYATAVSTHHRTYLVAEGNAQVSRVSAMGLANTVAAGAVASAETTYTTDTNAADLAHVNAVGNTMITTAGSEADLETGFTNSMLGAQGAYATSMAPHDATLAGDLVAAEKIAATGGNDAMMQFFADQAASKAARYDSWQNLTGTIDVGDLKYGIAADDNFTGTGYMVYTAESIHTRHPGFYANNADHFAMIRWDGTEWLVDNNGTWSTFTPVASDLLIASVDYGSDTVTMLEGQSSVVEGIQSGYANSDLVVTPNEFNLGNSNPGEFNLTGSYISLTPFETNRTVIGNVRYGVLGHDTVSGTGYLLYSAEDIQTREPAIAADQADHLAIVRWTGSAWEIDDNGTFLPFSTVDTDVILAEIDYGADTVTMYEGVSTVIEGIKAGYESTDIVVTPNQWNGATNTGEFGISGTYFTQQNGTFQWLQTEAQANWLDDIKDDSTTLIGSQYGNRQQYITDLSAAHLIRDNATRASRLAHSNAEYLDKKAKATGQFSEDLNLKQDMNAAYGTSSMLNTVGENTRLDVFVSAQSQYDSALADANKTYRLAVHDGTITEEQAYEDLVEARANAKYDFDVAIANADAALQIEYALSQQGLTTAAADSLKDFLTNTIQHHFDFELNADKRYQQLTYDQLLYNSTFATSETSAEAAFVVDDSISRNTFETANLAAKSAVTSTIVSNSSSAWAQFESSLAGARQSWWTSQSLDFLQKYVDESNLINGKQAAKATEINEFGLELKLAEETYYDSYWAAQVSENNAKAIAQSTFSHNIVPYAITHATELANIYKDFEIGTAAAQRKLTLGEDNGNPYDETDFANEIDGLTATREAAIEAADIAHSVGYVTLLTAFDTQIGQANLVEVDSITAADVQRKSSLQNASVELTTDLAGLDKEIIDGFASIKWNYESNSAGNYASSLSTSFSNGTTVRQQLELDVANAKATRSSATSTASINSDSAKSNAAKQRDIEYANENRDRINQEVADRRVATLGKTNAEIARVLEANNSLLNLAQNGGVESITPRLSIPGSIHSPESQESSISDYFVSIPSIDDYSESMFSHSSFDPSNEETSIEIDFGGDRLSSDQLQDGLLNNAPEKAIDPYSGKTSDDKTISDTDDEENGKAIESGQVPIQSYSFGGGLGQTFLDSGEHRELTYTSSNLSNASNNAASTSFAKYQESPREDEKEKKETDDGPNWEFPEDWPKGAENRKIVSGRSRSHYGAEVPLVVKKRWKLIEKKLDGELEVQKALKGFKEKIAAIEDGAPSKEAMAHLVYSLLKPLLAKQKEVDDWWKLNAEGQKVPFYNPTEVGEDPLNDKKNNQWLQHYGWRGKPIEGMPFADYAEAYLRWQSEYYVIMQTQHILSSQINTLKALIKKHDLEEPEHLYPLTDEELQAWRNVFTARDVALSTAPIYGEALDVKIILDPNESIGWKLLATGSLVLSIYTFSLAPNASGLRKAYPMLKLTYGLTEAITSSKALHSALAIVKRAKHGAKAAAEPAVLRNVQNLVRLEDDFFRIVNQLSCFVAGTPIVTPNGSVNIEDLKVGDTVLSRPEDEPDAENRPQIVEDVFERTAEIVSLVIGDQEIETTAEHPFYVLNKGWVNVDKMEIGDVLLGHNGEKTEVTSKARTSKSETVFNFRVANDHTYFVGGDDWQFSVWVHNANYEIKIVAKGVVEVYDDAGRFVNRFSSYENAARHLRSVGQFSDEQIDAAVKMKHLTEKAAEKIRKIPSVNGHSYPNDAIGYMARKAHRQKIAAAGWSNHGNKHLAARTAAQAKKFSESGNPAQYLPTVNNKVLENLALKKGFVVVNEGGTLYFFYKFDDVIGYDNGTATKWIRAELSGGVFHGHPMKVDRLPSEVRKYFKVKVK